MQVEVYAVGVIDEIGMVRVGVQVEQGMFDPPEVPDMLPGVASARHFGEKVEGNGVSEHQGEKQVAGGYEQVCASGQWRSRGRACEGRTRGRFISGSLGGV